MTNDINKIKVDFEEDDDGNPHVVLDHESLERLERMVDIGFIKRPEDRDLTE
jgi:hypothetical protein